MLEKLEKIQILCLGVFLFLAIIIGVKIFSMSISQNTITTTGSAFEIVKSDSGSLTFDINTRSANKQIAYGELQKQKKILEKYLKEKKITNFDFKASNGYYIYKRDAKTGMETSIVEAYYMSMPIEIKSDNVELIKEISTDISSLINKGVDIVVYTPSYSYSKLGELKVSLLEKASIDAKNRANAMLKPTGNRAGKVKNVRMGVYQITSPDSTNVSDVGINDSSSIDKKVTAVANVSFQIR